MPTVVGLTKVFFGMLQSACELVVVVVGYIGFEPF